jgi:PadR family transcriptional regulator PadR
MIAKELIAASTKPMILSILKQKASYGYEIIKRVHELSGKNMQWKDGMLYPVLHRLEQEGLVESFWQTSETGRKRKYYKIKPEGKAILETSKKQWLMVNAIFTHLWEPNPCLK